MLVGIDWDHHMSALLDKVNKMMPLYQNVFPKGMHGKYQLQEDCMFLENTLSVVLEWNHSCMSDLQGRLDRLMLHQDCIYHLDISVGKKHSISCDAYQIKCQVPLEDKGATH